MESSFVLKHFQTVEKIIRDLKRKRLLSHEFIKKTKQKKFFDDPHNLKELIQVLKNWKKIFTCEDFNKVFYCTYEYECKQNHLQDSRCKNERNGIVDSLILFIKDLAYEIKSKSLLDHLEFNSVESDFKEFEVLKEDKSKIETLPL